MVKDTLLAVVRQQPYPLLFATISGAHLYGFPSADSDYDLRGVHVLPLREVVGLKTGPETIEASTTAGQIAMDLVTYDARKFFRLLLKRNGYVLEQLYSPLVVHSTPVHVELKSIARGCITRHHAHHYLGFAETQWRLFEREAPPRVKPLLYVYRVLLTGIHLAQTGEVEANLVRLIELYRLPCIAELIQRKMSRSERATLDTVEVEFYRGEYERLRSELKAARDASRLPEEPTAQSALHDLMLRVRLGQ